VNAIPKAAEKIHHISNDMVKDAPTWRDIAPTVAQIISGTPLVVYNVSFDRTILNNSNKYAEMKDPSWSQVTTWLCCMNAFAKHYGKWNNRRRSYTWQPLTTAAAMMKVPIKDEHSAIGDCRMTLGVTHALLAKYAHELGGKR
jgi:DNA polymerase-3 subunit epsilon